MYRFLFEDNGIGMTEEFQGRLFEPFMREDRIKAIEHGMNDYLTKPMDMRQVGKVLQKWLGTPQSGDFSEI